MRLIDADAIYNKAEKNRQNGEIEDWEFDSIVDYLDGAPTINDAEIVVRCKDCEYSRYWDTCGEYKCDTGRYGFKTVPPDGYCSRGVRK